MELPEYEILDACRGDDWLFTPAMVQRNIFACSTILIRQLWMLSPLFDININNSSRQVDV
jgi:hypothetical protein